MNRSRLHICVLLHREDRKFDRDPYLVRSLAGVWRERGHRVTIARGVDQLEPADLLIPHVDISSLPPEYSECFSDYDRVANRRVTDITKSSFSRQLVGRHDAWDGPVIVKTDRNYGGIAERRLGRRSFWKLALPARYAGRLARRLGRGLVSNALWRQLACLPTSDYEVFDALADVPDGVHENPNLVVERFLPERLGRDYRVRYYFFVGDQEFGINVHSPRAVVKGMESAGIEKAAVPDALRRLRAELGFDLGKFDYVIRQGEPVLFDINWTPSMAVLQRWGLADEALSHLSGGLVGS